jgi:branched-chain amino acid transport system substrate-binding protein
MHFPAKTLSIAVAAALIAVGCGKQEAAAPAPAPQAAAPLPLIIKLGHSAPLTGPQSHIDKDNENGARMAVDDVNAAGIVIAGQPL